MLPFDRFTCLTPNVSRSASAIAAKLEAMFPALPQTLIDDVLPTGLRRRSSGRGCVFCQRPISRDDGFGRSEGVCAICIPRVTVSRPSRGHELVRRIIGGLRGRPALLGAQLCEAEGSHDVTAEERRVA